LENKPATAPEPALELVGIPAPDGAATLIDTDYQIGQDNYQARPLGVGIDIHGAVFAV
jgi:BCCT family betaine/carnitine transporter